MKRPSKKDIKAAVDQLKTALPGAPPPEHSAPNLPGKKSNKNRIRKQGV